MSNRSADFISGRRTAADWHATRAQLIVGQPQRWNRAFKVYFGQRLKLRYLDPIRVLQASGKSVGEGFSIVAIQCSLIEFLESAAQGINYKYVPHGQKLGKFEYMASKALFKSFLSKRAPFCESFSADAAEEFYASVRCGLLHEARTKNGWRISASGAVGAVADTKAKIVYRNNFQAGLLAYLDSYAAKLPHDIELQQAFIRKMDGLCQ